MCGSNLSVLLLQPGLPQSDHRAAGFLGDSLGRRHHQLDTEVLLYGSEVPYPAGAVLTGHLQDPGKPSRVHLWIGVWEVCSTLWVC